MKKFVVISVILMIVIVVFLAGCTDNNNDNYNNISKPDEDKFVGTWVKDSTEGYLKFLSDNTYISSSTSGTWSIKNESLVLEFVYQGQTGTTLYNYTFSNNDKTLTLIAIGTSTKTVLYKQ